MTGTTLPFDGAAPSARKGQFVIARIFEPIWHVRGSIALASGQSSDDAFDRLDSLFRERGTHYDRTGNTLTFSKKDPGAQDKMVVFDGGVLQVEQEGGGRVLRYHLTSKAFLFCFLAPLLFVLFAQATVYLGKVEKPKIEAKGKKAEAKKPPVPLNPIDKALGAPEPDKPKTDKKDKAKDKKPSPTTGYVFAGMFAVLYAFGRFFEARRIKALFRTRLLGA